MVNAGNEDWKRSKWGEGDELGALNTLVTEKVLSAMKLVRKGRVMQLGHPIFNGMPGRQAFHGPFYYLISQRTYDNRPPFRKPTKNKFGGALGRIEMSDHLGTHLDALNHIAIDNTYYNGFESQKITGNTGTTNLGIDTSPGIVTRGIAIDATGGEAIMPRGKPVSVASVEAFAKKHSIEFEEGDAVFFYTGVSKLFDNPDEYNTYFESSPGIGMELAEWISDKGISVSGSDTPSSEVTPAEEEGVRLPVHQHLITKHGIRLIDNIKLDAIIREGVFEFLFMVSPLRIRGGTASPVVPLAIY